MYIDKHFKLCIRLINGLYIISILLLVLKLIVNYNIDSCIITLVLVATFLIFNISTQITIMNSMVKDKRKYKFSLFPK